MQKILILVVDDDPSLVDFLVTALKSAKYEVESAYGGEQGIKKAKAGKPDLVVLDLMMPDLHGFDVCQTLRQDEELKGIKILISSAKGYEVDKRAAERLGADGYMSKPYTAQALLAAVKKLVGEP